MKNERSLFKLELDIAYPQACIASKYFNELKSLNQWLKRNDSVSIFGYRKYMLTGTGYERFEIFGNTVVPLSELKEVIRKIEKSEQESIEFVEYLKNQSIQK
jgi:hypothetical protein